MDKNQLKDLNHLKDLELQRSKDLLDYWLSYSNITTWQFWICLVLLILPLILLLLFLNKRKALLLGFYGYNVHVFFTYTDVLGSDRAYWSYPYKVMPILPSSFSLDVSFVPVAYMFFYQWILKTNRNYYLYMVILCALFAFVIKPIFVFVNLFQFDRGANYFHLFIGYIFVGLISKWITNLFVYMEKKGKE